MRRIACILRGLRGPPMNDTILRVFSYVRRYPGLASGMLGCAVFSTLSVVVFPKVTQDVLDLAGHGGDRRQIVNLALIGLGTFFVQQALNAARILLNNVFEQRVIFDLRSDLYSHIQRLPLGWFDNRATGDLMTRILEDVTSVERVLIDGIEQGVIAVLQIVVVIGMLAYYSPRMTLIALTPVPFLLAGALLYTTTARSRYKQQRVAASAMNSLLHDNLSGIRQIKTYVREDEEHRRFNAVSDRLREASLVIMRTWAVYNPSMNFLTNAGLALVLLFGGRSVLDRQMDYGTFAAILLLVGFLYDPIRQLHSLNQLFQAGRAAGARVFEIMDTPPETADLMTALAEDEEPDGIIGDVRFENVCFSYDEERPVLKSITLHAAPWPDRRPRRPDRRGQVDARQPAHAFLRVRLGRNPDRRAARCARYPKRARLRECHRPGDTGEFSFQRQRYGTICAWAAPRPPMKQLLAAAAAANARSFIERLPEGLEHDCRRAWRQAQRRRESSASRLPAPCSRIRPS